VYLIAKLIKKLLLKRLMVLEEMDFLLKKMMFDKAVLILKMAKIFV
jgi:hypothetical protein